MKRLIPGGLAGRLILLLLAALVLSQAISVAIFSSERREAVRAAQREAVVGRTLALARLLAETPPALHDRLVATASSRLLRFRVGSAPLIEAAPMSRAESRLAAALDAALGETARGGARVRLDIRAPSPRHWHHDRDDDDDDDDRKRRWQRPPVVELSLSAPLASGGWLNAETRFLRPPPGWAWPSVTAMVLMALAILLIVGISVRRITRPLSALEDAAERLGRGEAVVPLDETGPRELRAATAAFNAMQARLRRFVEDRTRLLAAIGHDLRTPITALRLRAEFVEDAETRTRILATLDEMQALVEATLTLARDDAATEPTEATDLGGLVRGLAADLAELGWPVTAAETPALKARCRPMALRRALRNLAENAVRYGGGARLSVARGAQGPVIRVDDDGPGIPEDRLEAVFEPFVRLEESRSRETGGVGLGLAIARSVARAHGGELLLRNRPDGGLRAELLLPAEAGAARD